MLSKRRLWLRRTLLVGLFFLLCQQIWRHGHDYLLIDQFAVVEPGKIYRGAWQKSWPMKRVVRDYHVKTVLALAHPSTHPLAVSERELAESMGVRWIHIPIADERGTNDYHVINKKLDEAAAVLADPQNYPIFFHCHHGINRASMVQMAYRTRYCGWTLEQATQEISRTFGLVTVNHGPDYRHMESYYAENVLPTRAPSTATPAGPSASTATMPPATASATTAPRKPL